MKIGIMTFWWSQDNYGQILQCYALQKYLRDAGHDAFLIRYNPSGDYEKNPFWIKLLKAFNPILLFRFFYKKIRSKKNPFEQNKNDRRFDEFRNKFIKSSEIFYNHYSELKENPPEADVYIVGSDQVWNPDCIGGKNKKSFEKIVNAYFLNFGTAKRMSYAASWGVKSLDEKKIKIISPLLKKFSYVSVREETGIELCNKCGYENAEWVCDPTMLFSAEDYRNIYKSCEIRKISKPYILLYMLNNVFEFDIKNVYNFSKEKNLSVVYVTGNGVVNKKDEFFATIPEWLWLVDNAEYVITNSFHCGVFCTIFEKRYGIIPLCGNQKGMNLRFDSLFERYGIEKRYVFENDFSVLDKEYNKNKIQNYLIDTIRKVFHA